ncbi:hypothetical protein ACFL5U_01440 [Candidatus Margulisiibacteriota bacterium]
MKERNWILANHTAAHFPVGEDRYINKFCNQFNECESKFKELLGEESKFWVLPFDRVAHRSKDLVKTFKKGGAKRYLVLVGDKLNTQESLNQQIIRRIIAPFYTGQELIRYINCTIEA